MRALVVALALVAGCAPSLPASYHCANDSECVSSGVHGRCETNGACSFPDDGCTSGWRYGQLDPPGVAGQCVDVAGGGGDLGMSDGGGGGHGITRIGTSSVPAASRTAVTLPAPAGLVAGDVVVACVFSPDGQASFTAPSGWTPQADLHGAIGGELHVAYYVHVADAGEPASWTFTLGAAASTTAAAVAYRGVDLTRPVDVSTTNQFEGSAFLAPSITTTKDGAELVTVFVQAMMQTLSWRAPAGMQTAVDDGAIAVFDATQATAGATGDKQASLGALGLPGIGAVDFLALTPK